MSITPIEDVAFDDATTFAMGEAFDRTCESIRIIGSSVPVREIIAKQIIDAAKNGERDPARLYEQALIIFGIVDLSKLLISVCDPPSQPTLRSTTQRNYRKKVMLERLGRFRRVGAHRTIKPSFTGASAHPRRSRSAASDLSLS
jgi:hypothetical protein